MGIEVVLQDENCNHISEMVYDPGGVVARCLPDLADATYACVRFIDPYGDTIFNPLQASAMIGEWDRLKGAFTEHNAEVLWAGIRKLIVRCSQEPHSYIRFIGD